MARKPRKVKLPLVNALVGEWLKEARRLRRVGYTSAFNTDERARATERFKCAKELALNLRLGGSR